MYEIYNGYSSCSSTIRNNYILVYLLLYNLLNKRIHSVSYLIRDVLLTDGD